MSSSKFLSKLQSLENVIVAYSKYYEVDGVISWEDLYQEGLMELSRIVKIEPYKSLPDKKFEAYFRVCLKSKLHRQVKYFSRVKRDWKSTILVGDSDVTNHQSVDQSIDSFVFDQFVVESPHEELETKKKFEEYERFVEDVKSGLDDEAQWIFDEMLSGEIPDDLKDNYQRVPGHMSITLISLIFGWDRGFTWRSIKRIRKRATALIMKSMRAGSLLWNEQNTRSILQRPLERRKKYGV